MTMSVPLYFMDIMLVGACMYMIVHHPFSRSNESKMINHKINLYKDSFSFMEFDNFYVEVN
jgi:hypothetical protein